MDLARMLAYVAGTVDQELLLRNEYLAAENRILKTRLKGRLMLSDTLLRRSTPLLSANTGREQLQQILDDGGLALTGQSASFATPTRNRRRRSTCRRPPTFVTDKAR